MTATTSTTKAAPSREPVSIVKPSSSEGRGRLPIPHPPRRARATSRRPASPRGGSARRASRGRAWRGRSRRARCPAGGRRARRRRSSSAAARRREKEAAQGDCAPQRRASRGRRRRAVAPVSSARADAVTLLPLIGHSCESVNEETPGGTRHARRAPRRPPPERVDWGASCAARPVPFATRPCAGRTTNAAAS